MELKKFNPINVSSKFAICGLPIRVDTYKTCSFNCKYCFSNYRKIMEFKKELQIANLTSVKNMLDRILNKKQIKENNFLDTLIAEGITWHCGGMSDPFQPIENELHVTNQLIDITNRYNIHILFSTKTDDIYNCNIKPNLHTFQFSITNLDNRKDIEPNVADIHKRIQLYKELKKEDFTQMGLLNLKPEIRLNLYKSFIYKLKQYNIPFSLADNDLHYVSSGKCCCGDPLIHKSTNFNNTSLIKKYGINY